MSRLGNAGLSTVVAASAGLLGATQAYAQSEPSQIDEVIVTALRRERAALDTATAVSAVSDEALRRDGVRDLPALAGRVPGLTAIQAGPSNTRLVIRGLQGVGEPIVGLYYDETPVSGLVGAGGDGGGSTALLSLADVDRIEVLRGPQGALYGAGAMGGAVRVLFRKPGETPDGYLVAGLSLRDGDLGWRMEGAGGGAIAEGLSGRLSLWAEDQADYVENRVLGRLADAGRLRGARLALRARPHDRLTLDVSGMWQSNEGEIPWWTLGGADFEGRNQARFLNDDRQAILSATAVWRAGSWEATAVASRAERSLDQVSADVSYQFGGMVGDAASCARVRGGGSACSAAQQAAFDDYVRTFIPSVVYPQQDASEDSAEVRLTTLGDGPFGVTLGAFYADRRIDLDNAGVRADALTGELLRPLDYTFRRYADDALRQAALFGEGEWRLSPALSVTLGGRVFEYRRAVGGGTSQGLDLINARITPYQRFVAKDDGGLGKVALAWRPDARQLVYLEASQGYRPGGANQVLNLPAPLVVYGSDRLTTYQVGYRAELLARRLQLDLAAYRTDWRDMQVAGSRPDGLFRFIANAGEARSEGFEAAASWRAGQGLTLEGALSWNDARLTEDQISDVVVAPGRAGDRIPYAPETTARLAAAWTGRLAGGQAAAGLEARYVGETGSELRTNNPFYRRLPDAVLASARASFGPEAGPWEASVRLDNAFDEVALLAVNASGVTAGQTLAVSAPPRTLAVELRVRY